MKIPRGFRCCNPGNLKEDPKDKTKWVGERATDDDPIFEEFETMEYGLRAMLIVIRTYIRKKGLNTIEKIIPVYAPSIENNVEMYIQTVEIISGFCRDAVIDFDYDTMKRIIPAMVYHENGRPLPKGVFERAWELI